MGPLCFCSNCGSQLSNEWKEFNEKKERKLKDADLNELSRFSEEELLGQTVYEYFEERDLPLCCRVELSSYNDLTPEICN